MDIHKNARLTLRSREALVETVIGGLGFSRAAPAFASLPKPQPSGFAAISTLKELPGLRDRSSRPASQSEPLRLPGRVGHRAAPPAHVPAIRSHAAPDSVRPPSAAFCAVLVSAAGAICIPSARGAL
jgi:hypothetical protein